MLEITTIACVGAGLIGSSWSTLFSKEGYRVKAYDLNDTQINKSKAIIDNNFNMLQTHGIMTADEVAQAKARISHHTDLEEALQGIDLIQENVAEDLAEKQALLEKIDQIDTTATFCSSSSAIKISLISQKSQYASRCVGAHPFNPPHLIPLVELTQWEKTDPEHLKRAYDFYKKVRKEPIILNKEVVGFIGNRLQFAYTREAVDLVMNGVCSVEDVDKASLYGLGFRYAIIGPNLNGDLNGGENGLRDYYSKYGPTMNSILADAARWDTMPEEYGQSIGPEGINKAKAVRPKEQGNTREEILAYRDRMLLAILKLHNKI